jgi:hypothetical protein
MDQIAKALSKNRSLTPENAHLFYDVQNTTLTLYDVTSTYPFSQCYFSITYPNRRPYATRSLRPRLAQSEPHLPSARQVRQDGQHSSFLLVPLFALPRPPGARRSLPSPRPSLAILLRISPIAHQLPHHQLPPIRLGLYGRTSEALYRTHGVEAEGGGEIE